jgi:hypothetical protein
MGNARDFIPALNYGNKILPSDLAGMLNLPTVGNIIYVDPTAGSDTANGGTAQNDAYATVKKAYDQAVSGQHDVILISPTGGTGRTTEAQAIVWNKRFTHLIGSAAPTQTNPRAGMSFSDLAGAVCFTLTNNGCIFQNITIASFTDNNVLFKLTSAHYNYFGNVHFAGIGNDTTGDDTAGRSLVLSASEENTFEGCTLGLDTVTRSVANASLELTGSCARNIFRNCLFPIFADNAGALFVKADTGNCNERFLIFENCIFTNPTNGSSTTLTIAMKLSATGNGFIYLKDCMVKGVTDWTDVYTDLFVNMPVVNTANQGFAIIAAT